MSIVVFVESSDKKVKKTSMEAVFYASKIDNNVIAVALGSAHDESQLGELGKWGATDVLLDSANKFDSGDLSLSASAISEVMKTKNAKILVLATSPFGSGLAACVAVQLNASLATNVAELPDTSSGFVVKRSIFTGKAFQKVNLTNENKVIAIKKNAVDVVENGSVINISSFSAEVDGEGKIKVKGVDMIQGDILLPEAERVVSAGRGLKGPENWGMVEELASVLKAATACSKPVSDMDWRPHHEHVGQTGIKISPQLYIAIGISGAIQHLAGVNSSKTIVVINKDPEAPFFKEADYGIVGDAFEVVPKLIEALKANN